MANVFDARDVNTGQQYGRRRPAFDDDCGADIDWTLGLQGLAKARKRPTGTSASLLTKVIEGEIIPRLLVAHTALNTPPAKAAEPKSLADLMNGEAFAQLVLTSEVEQIIERLEQLRDRGFRLERIFLDILAPVARKLGDFWIEDRCTFTDVTLGLARLHQVLHEMGRRETGAGRDKERRRAYFAPSPGEQHTFGLSMLEEFFLHAGWETASDHDASVALILHTASTRDLDVIGFTVGCNEFLDPLSGLIERTRKASRNPDVAIMVGGRIFADDPGAADKVGAATIVCDGLHAVNVAEKLVSEVPRSGGVRTLS